MEAGLRVFVAFARRRHRIPGIKMRPTWTKIKDRRGTPVS
jgi:hypothetical protein